MRIPACIEHNTVSLEGLYLINQVTFVIRLKVRQIDLWPDSLDIQQNLCHSLRTVDLGLPQPESVQVRSVENKYLHSEVGVEPFDSSCAVDG